MFSILLGRIQLLGRLSSRSRFSRRPTSSHTTTLTPVRRTVTHLPLIFRNIHQVEVKFEGGCSIMAISLIVKVLMC